LNYFLKSNIGLNHIIGRKNKLNSTEFSIHDFSVWLVFELGFVSETPIQVEKKSLDYFNVRQVKVFNFCGNNI